MPFTSLPITNPFKDSKTKPKQNPDDELNLIKAAAWAWYQHGSGSEPKPILEFDLTNIRSHRPPPQPSRYKLEAIRTTAAKQGITKSPITPVVDKIRNISLLDKFERDNISKHLGGHIEVGHNGSLENSEIRNERRRRGKKKKLFGGFWVKHAAVCGSQDDVVEARARRPSEKPVPVVKVAN